VIGASGPVYSDDDGNPVPVDAGGLEVMSMALLSDDGPLAWRGAMAHAALSDLFETTAWSGPDTVVVDMPPGTGDVALTTLQEVPVDGVVLVTTPFHAAVSDTGRALELFEENDVPVLGVVSNMGEFVCDECGTPHNLFGGDDPIEALDMPILAELPRSIRRCSRRRRRGPTRSPSTPTIWPPPSTSATRRSGRSIRPRTPSTCAGSTRRHARNASKNGSANSTR